jgi:hypothetical protein
MRKYLELYLRYYILNLLFRNSVVFIYLGLQRKELNDIQNCQKKKFPDFIIGKIGGRLIFGRIR